MSKVLLRYSTMSSLRLDCAGDRAAVSSRRGVCLAFGARVHLLEGLFYDLGDVGCQPDAVDVFILIVVGASRVVRDCLTAVDPTSRPAPVTRLRRRQRRRRAPDGVEFGVTAGWGSRVLPVARVACRHTREEEALLVLVRLPRDAVGHRAAHVRAHCADAHPCRLISRCVADTGFGADALVIVRPAGVSVRTFVGLMCVPVQALPTVVDVQLATIRQGSVIAGLRVAVRA